MATEQTIAVDSCREQLRIEHAKFFPGTEHASTPITNVKEVRVGWEFSSNKDFSQLENFLQLYTWPKNEKQQRWVQDPVVDGVVLTGRWRQAFTTRVERRDSQGSDVVTFWIVLTLRLGWAESLDWGEARIAEGASTQTNAETLGSAVSDDKAGIVRVLFPNFSPYYAESAIVAVGETVSDARVQEQTLSGVWYVNIASLQEQQDGSHSLVLTLAKNKYILNSYRDYLFIRGGILSYAHNVPKGVAQTLIDELKAKGYSVTASFNQGEETVDLVATAYRYNELLLLGHVSSINCDSVSYANLYLGVSGPDAYQLPYSTSPGYSYSRQINESQGAYDIITTMRVRRQRDYDQTRDGNGPLMTTDVYRRFGVLGPSGLYTLPDPEVGKDFNRQMQVQDDCSIDEQISTSKAVYRRTDEFTARQSALTSVKEIGFANAHGSQVPYHTANRGKIVELSSSLNRFSYYDGRHVEQSAVPFTVALRQTGQDAFTQTHEKVRLNAEQLDAVSREQGEVVDQNVSVNALGYYDQTIRSQRGVKASHAFDSRRDALSAVDVVDTANDDQEMSLPSPVAGYAYSGEQSLNRFSYYDHKVVRERAVRGETGEQGAGGDLFSLRVQNRIQNAEAPITAGALVPGLIPFADSSLNRFSYYDGAQGYNIAGEAVIVSSASAVSALSSGTREEHRNARAPIAVGARPAGAVLSARSSINGFSYYDGGVELVYAVPYAGRSGAAIDSASVQETYLYRNRDGVPAALPRVVGFAYDDTFSVNEAGYFDGSRRAAYGTLLVSGGVRSESDLFESRRENRFQNSDAAIEAPVSGSGWTGFAQNSVNRFSYYDGIVGIAYAGVYQYIPEAVTETAFEIVYGAEVRNASVPVAPDTFSVGEIHEASSSVNRFSYYDGRKTRRLQKASERGQTTQMSAYLETRFERVERNAAGLTAITPTRGRVYETQQSMNAASLYDKTILEIAPIYFDGGERASGFDARTRSTRREIQNSPDPIVVGAFARGRREASRSSLNRAGYYDGDLLIESVEDKPLDAAFASMYSPAVYAYGHLYENQPEVMVLPSPVVGRVFTQTASINGFGYYDGQQRVEISHPYAWEDWIGTTLFSFKTIHSYNATPDLPSVLDAHATAVLGNGVTVDNRITRRQDGSFDGTSVVVHEQERKWEFSFNRGIGGGSEKVYVYNWQDSDALDPQAWLDAYVTVDVLSDAQFSLNTTNTYNGQVILRDRGTVFSTWWTGSKKMYWLEDWDNDGNDDHEVYLARFTSPDAAEGFVSLTSTVYTPGFPPENVKNAKETEIIESGGGILVRRVRSLNAPFG
jgi:hypothetical protein